MFGLEGIRSYVTFRHLGGSTVPVDQVLAELSRWPLDGILGYLAIISLEAVQAGHEFADPRRQGQYLNLLKCCTKTLAKIRSR